LITCARLGNTRLGKEKLVGGTEMVLKVKPGMVISAGLNSGPVKVWAGWGGIEICGNFNDGKGGMMVFSGT
jgi:hypothetical protein